MDVLQLSLLNKYVLIITNLYHREQTHKVITNAEVSVHLNADSELTLIVTLAVVMDKVIIINYGA